MAKTYTVKAGDTLSKIAETMLGDASRWKEILEANKDEIKDPNVIKAGLKLTIPTDDDKTPGKPRHTLK